MAGFGTITLELLLLLSTWAAALALVGARRRSRPMIRAARLATYAAATVASLSLLILTHALAISNFALTYVQRYSDRAMPLFYKLTAVWGGQEGSLLFWAWLLAVMSAVVTHTNRRRLPDLTPYLILTLMLVLCFFSLLLLFAANPFETFLTGVPAEGRGLKPLLQNPFMVIHPPALYLGYVGLTIPFALGVAALLAGRTDDEWLRASRPWALVSWFWLSLGLVLGMLWAYEELGWGGYWSWDPVENAGLIPWLTATAFLHASIVWERRGTLRTWSFPVAALTFELTLLGTFFTRSGLIQSVHAFARSTIGYWFLIFMGLVLLGSVAISIRRWRSLRTEEKPASGISREWAMVVGIWLLTLTSFLVLGLTLLPTLSSLFGQTVSISPSAFTRWVAPLGLALLFLKGVGPTIRWGKSTARALRRPLLPPLCLAAVTVVGLLALHVRRPLSLLTFGLSAFVLSTIVLEIIRATRARQEEQGHSSMTALASLVGQKRRHYGSSLVHLGVALMFVGFGGDAYKTEVEVAMARGQSVQVGRYTLRYDGADTTRDEQKEMTTARLSCYERGELIRVLRPALWTYFKDSEQPTREVDIYRTARDDLFVALGSHDPQSTTGSFQAILNPLVSWIWVGFFLLTAGTVLGVWPERAKAVQAAPHAAPLGERASCETVVPRWLRLIRWGLPLALAAAAAALSAKGDSSYASTALLATGGALLGSSISWGTLSVAALLGRVASAPSLEREIEAELERLAAAPAPPAAEATR